MKLAQAIEEARAIDARAAAGAGTTDDVMRAFELVESFDHAVAEEPTEERRLKLATTLVRRLYGKR
jgi:hypothetical protein